MTIGELVQAGAFSGAAGLAVSTIVGSLSGTNGRKVLRALRGDSAVYEAPLGDTDMYEGDSCRRGQAVLEAF